MIIKSDKTILLKGEKIVTVKASKRAKAHKRKVKTKDEIEDYRGETPLERVLDFYEALIKDQDYESCSGFRDDGSIAFQKDGEKDRIGFTESEGKMLKGTTFTHNHPIGHSFSDDDIKCACRNEMKEMRVVTTHNEKYIMKLKDGKNFSVALWENVLSPAYVDSSNRTRNNFENAINNGEMTIKEACDRHWDTVWGLLSEKCPMIDYKKVIY